MLQTAIITLVSRSFHTMMFAHARHVILDTRLLSLPASLTVLETASLIYVKLASLEIAYLCNFDPFWNALSMKRRQRYGKKLMVMLVLQISDKFLLHLSRDAIDPMEAGGHWNV